jgi:PadR family transcriptional regulator PadR
MAPSPLGEFEVVVLMAVAHLKGAGYGSSIREEIAARTSRRASRGAVYITLDRLEAKGLLESALGDPLPQRGGRPRRAYRLTTAGKKALRHSVSMFVKMHAGLEPLLHQP